MNADFNNRPQSTMKPLLVINIVSTLLPLNAKGAMDCPNLSFSIEESNIMHCLRAVLRYPITLVSMRRMLKTITRKQRVWHPKPSDSANW